MAVNKHPGSSSTSECGAGRHGACRGDARGRNHLGSGVVSGDGSLTIVSVSDTGSGLAAPVQGRPFDVVVEVRDDAGELIDAQSGRHDRAHPGLGDGALGGNSAAVIARNSSSATISMPPTPVENGVVLRVAPISAANQRRTR